MERNIFFEQLIILYFLGNVGVSLYLTQHRAIRTYKMFDKYKYIYKIESQSQYKIKQR